MVTTDNSTLLGPITDVKCRRSTITPSHTSHL